MFTPFQQSGAPRTSLNEFRQVLALARRGPDEARGRLDEMITSDPGGVRSLVLGWLQGEVSAEGARALFPVLVEWRILQDLLFSANSLPEPRAVKIAARVAEIDPSFVGLLIEDLDSGDPTRTGRIAKMLGEVEIQESHLRPILRNFKHLPSRVQANVARAVGKLKPERAIVEELMSGAQDRVRANLIESLLLADYPDIRPILETGVGDSNNRVRANAALGLCRLGDPRGEEALTAMLRSSDPRFQISACWAAGQARAEKLMPTLKALAMSRDDAARRAAQKALSRMVAPKSAAASAAKPAIEPSRPSARSAGAKPPTKQRAPIWKSSVMKG